MRRFIFTFATFVPLVESLVYTHEYRKEKPAVVSGQAQNLRVQEYVLLQAQDHAGLRVPKLPISL